MVVTSAEDCVRVPFVLMCNAVRVLKIVSYIFESEVPFPKLELFPALRPIVVHAVYVWCIRWRSGLYECDFGDEGQRSLQVS